MSRCNRCHRRSCSCEDSCGCKFQLTGDCVFTKLNLECLDVTKGDDLDSILQKINDEICDLGPPTGIIYTGEEGQIDISDDNVISLDVEITTQLTNIEADIEALQECCDESVKSITSSTIVVTQPTAGNYVINYTPSAIPNSQKSGIFENFLTPVPSVGSGYTYTKNLTSYALNDGDEVRFKFILKRTAGNTQLNNITVYSSATPLLGFNLVESGGVCLINDFTVCETVGEIILTVTNKSLNRMNGYMSMYTYPTTPLSAIFTDQYTLYPTNFPPRIGQKTAITVNLADINIIFNHTDNPSLETFTGEIIRKI